MFSRRPSQRSDASQTETPSPKIARRTTTGGIATPSAPPQEGTERVKVVIRVRPPHSHETAGGVGLLEEDKETIVLQRKHANVAQTDFNFDKVLGPEATQSDVYEAAVKPIVEDVMKGYNGTIMAYGQTGAGKTYTLSSIQSANNIGMMPRAAANVFAEISADSSHIYNVVMSYVQIYMELIQDLLKPENENLQIRESSNGVFIAGVEEQPVRSVEDCLNLLQLGDQNRKVAFTHLNAHSSRSHAIVMLTIVKRRRNGANKSPEEEKMKVGKLFIVDLAGSERLKKSLSTGQRANEAKAINLSLTTLGICINARADRTSKHVPFRDSKLTRLLQESLGGNAKTSLVVAVADAMEHADETLQSLQFGSRAMHVQTKAVVNESLGSKLLNADLLAKLSQLEISPCLVDASLLAKEEELERAHEALQGERDKASKIIAALQEEKESQEAAQARMLNAAQDELHQHRQEMERGERMLKRVETKVAALEEEKQQQVQEMQAKVQAAELKAQAAEERQKAEKEEIAAELNRVQQQTREKMDALELQHGCELTATAQRHREELLAMQSLLQLAIDERQTLEQKFKEEIAGLLADRKKAEAEWADRVQAAEASAEEGLEEQRKRSAEGAQALADLQESSAAALADMHSQLDSLQQRHAALADDHSTTLSEAAALRTELRETEAGLASSQQELAQTQAQLAALERSHNQLQALWMSNRRLNEAARTIQRHYKAWRLRSLRDQSSRDAHALAIARRDQCNLEGEKALLERERHQHLLWSGQALVAGSLLVLEEAVQQIRTTFLMPSKELKTLGNLKSRMSLSPGLSGSPRSAAAYSPSPLSRTLSFVSDASGQSFVARHGTPEGPLGQGQAVLPNLKQQQPTPNRLQALGNSIQAHWGTPTK